MGVAVKPRAKSVTPARRGRVSGESELVQQLRDQVGDAGRKLQQALDLILQKNEQIGELQRRIHELGGDDEAERNPSGGAQKD